MRRVPEHERLHPGAEEFVYVVQAESGPIKIGTAGDPIKRLAALQTACWETLTLIGARPGGRAVEHWLHEELAMYRLLGEWFRPDDRVLLVCHRFLQSGAVVAPSMLWAAP